MGCYSQVVHDYVFSEMNGSVTLFDGATTTFWGFGRYNTGQPLQLSMPGPLLRYTVGDSVVVHFRNDDIDDHTIHLHGLDASQINDGVPFTSFPVLAGDSTNYSFNALFPGVHLYHCHVATVFHLPMGMYGMLVIDYPGNLMYNGGPGYNREYQYLSSDMDRSWNDNPTSPGLFYKYSPDYFLINGLSQNQLFADTSQVIMANAGDSILLRLANIGYTTAEYCFPPGSNPTIYLSDGRVIPTPISVDSLRIYPGERYSILLRPTNLIEDYIKVNVYDMFNDALIGTNNIGINEYNPPTQLPQPIVPDWDIYPNPFEEGLNIVRPTNLIESGVIYDYTGKEIQRFELTTQRSYLNLADLASGFYFLRSDRGYSTGIIKR
jgi:FtsP/CotA-like multicopper oxidase with cupredoxin domain